MQIRLQHLIFAALVVSLVSLAYGLNFMWFTDIEITNTGGRSRFWHGDTLDGPVRSNDTIGMMQDPQFYGFVVTSANGFEHGTGYNPSFHGPAPIFNAPRVELPVSASWIRQQAIAQGQYFNAGDSMMARVHIEGNNLRLWWTPMGMPFDTNAFTFHALPDSAIVFFDAPIVNLWGTVSSILIFGCAGRAGLEDNILYASSSEPQHGRIVLNHTEKFALVSEGEIKILNTWANGRGNSNMRGNYQPNHDSTDIYLNGFFFALGGGFTFEQQNDPDSGYVFQYPPGNPHTDDRGQIWLWGGITQRQRGYVHRSNNGSTGYLKAYHYDPQLKFWNAGVFDLPENQLEPRALNFGSLLMGDTARDTVRVINGYLPIDVDSMVVPTEFRATFQWGSVYVSFIPDHAGEFNDTLRLYVGYYDQWLSVPVSGTGVSPSDANSPFIPHPSSFILSAFPNPFNAETRITFSLPVAGSAALNVFDISGRLVRMLVNGNMQAGEHLAIFNGEDLPSGVYFVTLRTSQRMLTQKLLLLK